MTATDLAAPLLETKIATLGDLATPTSVKAGVGSDLPVYAVTKHRGFVPSAEYFSKQVFSRDTSGYKLVRRGEFAYATIHLDEGSIGTAPEDSLVSPMYTSFAVNESIVDPAYLFLYLKSPRAMAIYPQLGKGSAERRKSIPFTRLKELPVPLPSLNEQRRLASILGNAAGLRTKRRQALAHLDALSTSTFQVLLGRNDWPRRAFGELCDRVTVGVVVKPASHYVSDGIPALRSLNVRPGGLVMENLVHFSEISHNGPLRKSQLWPGDVVTVRTGNAGTSAVVPANAGPLNAIDLIIATPSPGVMSAEYAVAFLNSDDGKRMVLGESRGQIQQHFNVKSLQMACIPVPPIHVQHELASQLAQIERVRRVQLSQLAEFDALFASLQHRAFSGQL